MVLSCSQFIQEVSCAKPAQLLPSRLTISHDGDELILERTIGPQFCHRTLMGQSPFRNDADMSAKFFDYFEHVRCQKHRRATAHATPQRVPQHAGSYCIDPFEWLIEEQQVRIWNQGRGQRELLLH